MADKQWKMESEIGPLYLVASAKGLKGVFWEEKKGVEMLPSLKHSSTEARILASAVAQLNEYFAGKRKKFELDFDVEGTEFQKKVWAKLLEIPYGKTFSYSELARSLKNDQAVRAVGTANGKNPLCVVIPCHRVIALHGGLGGYSGGLARKEKLLKLEGRQ
jgi:methylated-DNA-[protein]-cysteine S-methyltransferase